MAETSADSVLHDVLVRHGASIELFRATTDMPIFVSPLRLEYIEHRHDDIPFPTVKAHFQDACSKYLFAYFSTFFALFKDKFAATRMTHERILESFKAYRAASEEEADDNKEFKIHQELRRWLVFPEIPLVLSGASTTGSGGRGVGGGLAKKLLCNTAPLLVKLLDSEFRYVSKLFGTFNIFSDGFGPDKFNDMTTFLILPVLLRYTTEICKDISRKLASNEITSNAISLSEELDIDQIISSFQQKRGDFVNFERFTRSEYLKPFCQKQKFVLPMLPAEGSRLRIFVPWLLLDSTAELFVGRHALLGFAARDEILRARVLANQVRELQSRMSGVLAAEANKVFQSCLREFRANKTLFIVVTVMTIAELDKFFADCQRPVMDCTVLLPSTGHLRKFLTELRWRALDVDLVHELHPSELPDTMIRKAFWNDSYMKSVLPRQLKDAIMPEPRTRYEMTDIQSYDAILRAAEGGENYLSVAFRFKHAGNCMACVATTYQMMPSLTVLDRLLFLKSKPHHIKFLMMVAIYDETRDAPSFTVSQLFTHASVISIETGKTGVTSFRKSLSNGCEDDVAELSKAVVSFNEVMQHARDPSIAPFSAVAPLTDGTVHMFSPPNGWSMSDPTDFQASASKLSDWFTFANETRDSITNKEMYLRRALDLKDDVDTFPSLASAKSRIMVDPTGRIAQTISHLNPQYVEVIGAVAPSKPTSDDDHLFYDWRMENVETVMMHSVFEYLKKVVSKDDSRVGRAVATKSHPTNVEESFDNNTDTNNTKMSLCSLNAKDLCGPKKDCVGLLEYAFELLENTVVVVIHEAPSLADPKNVQQTKLIFHWMKSKGLNFIQPLQSTGPAQGDERPLCLYKSSAIRHIRSVYLDPFVISTDGSHVEPHNYTPCVFEFEVLEIPKWLNRFRIAIISVHFMEGKRPRCASERLEEMTQIARRIKELRGADRLNQAVHYIIAGDMNILDMSEITQMTDVLKNVTNVDYRGLNCDKTTGKCMPTNISKKESYDHIFVPSSMSVVAGKECDLVIGDLQSLSQNYGGRNRTDLAAKLSDHNPIAFTFDAAAGQSGTKRRRIASSTDARRK